MKTTHDMTLYDLHKYQQRYLQDVTMFEKLGSGCGTVMTFEEWIDVNNLRFEFDNNVHWVDMETNECHCYDCCLFDRDDGACRYIDKCKNPTDTYRGFYEVDDDVTTLRDEDYSQLFKNCKR